MRVTLRSRSLVSASSRALATFLDVKGEGVATPMFSAASDCMCGSFSDIAKTCCASK